MTKEEEMAEQYAVENWEHLEEGQTDYKALKQAFLAGLKAGKEKAKKEIEENLLKCYSGYPKEIEE